MRYRLIKKDIQLTSALSFSWKNNTMKKWDAGNKTTISFHPKVQLLGFHFNFLEQNTTNTTILNLLNSFQHNLLSFVLILPCM